MHIFGFLHHIPLRAQLMTAFIAPAIIITLSSLAVYVNLGMAMKRYGEVENSIRAITIRGELLRSVLDAETGERGYVITGDREFLEPYQKALSQFDLLADDWRKSSEPQELQQLEKIEALFYQWVNEVAMPVIEARQQAPGRLVSRGFDALYHINFLGDVLNGTAVLPEAEADEFVDELQENMTLAARSAQTTEQADEWVLAASKAKQLPELYRRIYSCTGQQ